MNKLYILIFILLFRCSGEKAINYNALQPKLKFNSNVSSVFSFERPVAFSSREGLQRLKRATADGLAVDFYNTVNFFASQVYPTTCGPANLKTALSALYAQENISFPISKETTLIMSKNGMHSPHFIFTERNLFDNISQQDIDRGLTYDVIARQKPGPDGKYGGGIAPADLVLVGKTFDPVKIDHYIIDSPDVSENNYQEFKAKFISILKDPKQLVIINYHLGIEMPITSGHYSLVVAFDAKTESVLLLNTMTYYTQWNWVLLKDVYKSINKVLNGIDRGYLIVSIKEEFRKKSDEINAKDSSVKNVKK